MERIQYALYEHKNQKKLYLALRDKDDFSILPEEGKQMANEFQFIKLSSADYKETDQLVKSIKERGWYLYKVDIQFKDLISKP
jgi:uncharacterized protein YcgL (UPF0745 family)